MVVINKNTKPFSLNLNRFNEALLVAGNFKDGAGVQPWDWPVTPRWTSLWLLDELYDYGYDDVDTAFFHMGNLIEVGKTEEIFSMPKQVKTQDYITGKIG